MIEDAENSKLIKKGDTLIEPTGGNTGIGLAIGAAIKGYKLILTIPDHFSQEKMKTLERYNAQIVLADHKRGNDCHIQKAIEIRNEHPEYICLNQFANLSNPKSHYYGTGQEIINTMQNKIDYFIASIGSGGTIMGVGKKLKENIANVQVIGVQPKGCDMKNNIYIAHKIQATAVGKVGTFVDFSIIDEMIDVDFEEVQQIREYMSKEQGLFVGISSGANILAAFKKACTLDKDKVIVTIAPDSGRSYLDIR
jgi:cysteine synthase A